MSCWQPQLYTSFNSLYWIQVSMVVLTDQAKNPNAFNSLYWILACAPLLSSIVSHAPPFNSLYWIQEWIKSNKNEIYVTFNSLYWFRNIILTANSWSVKGLSILCIGFTPLRCKVLYLIAHPHLSILCIGFDRWSDGWIRLNSI